MVMCSRIKKEKEEGKVKIQALLINRMPRATIRAAEKERKEKVKVEAMVAKEVRMAKVMLRMRKPFDFGLQPLFPREIPSLRMPLV